MKTKEELINDLKNSKRNYTEDQIAEIVDKYETYLNTRTKIPSRADNYKKIADILGLKSLNDVRFYKIMNASAVVIRDTTCNRTTVSFSFYNPVDLITRCRNEDKISNDDNVGDRIFDENNIPILHQITVSKDYDSCLYSAMNYSQDKYTIVFNDIRISELAVYEAWIKLCKSKSIPRYYRKFDLDIQIVSLSELNKRTNCSRKHFV